MLNHVTAGFTPKTTDVVVRLKAWLTVMRQHYCQNRVLTSTTKTWFLGKLSTNKLASSKSIIRFFISCLSRGPSLSLTPPHFLSSRKLTTVSRPMNKDGRREGEIMKEDKPSSRVRMVGKERPVRYAA